MSYLALAFIKGRVSPAFTVVMLVLIVATALILWAFNLAA